MEPDLPRIVQGDPSRLQQVFGVLWNKVLRIPKRAQCGFMLVWSECRIMKMEETLTIEIRDTGTGYP